MSTRNPEKSYLNESNPKFNAFFQIVCFKPKKTIDFYLCMCLKFFLSLIVVTSFMKDQDESLDKDPDGPNAVEVAEPIATAVIEKQSTTTIDNSAAEKTATAINDKTATAINDKSITADIEKPANAVAAAAVIDETTITVIERNTKAAIKKTATTTDIQGPSTTTEKPGKLVKKSTRKSMSKGSKTKNLTLPVGAAQNGVSGRL